MSDRVGQQLGNYRLLRLLGHGGFADVYLGEHVYLQSQAALKILHSRLSEEEAACFVTEARTLARLNHPHIVRVLDFAVDDGLPFLVMGYAPGGSLRMRHPAGSRLPLATIVSYVSQVASALQYAHEQQLIHRDVKPENMLLGAREEVLLADFGLATLAPTSSRSTQAMESSLNGTTAYLAPEQLQGKPHPASDQYALGVAVYEWLCGRRPFGGSPIKIAMQHLSIPPASLREQVPELPPAVEEVVLRALAKEPRLRFARVEDFANALQQAAQHAGSSVVALGAAAEVSHPARAAAGPPSTLTQEQVVMTPSAGATPQVEGEEQEAPADTEPPEPLWKVPTGLTPLVGREQDVAAACALLSRPGVRLVTLLGAGGIGKTRLAMQVAMEMRERYADGVCFVGLAPISDPNLLLSSIAHELGLQEGGMQPLVETVKAWLRDKQFLLLLDNFEQIVSAATLLAELLVACPRLAIVVTSREVLHLQAEHLFPVPPLALPDLVHLPECEQLAQYAAVALFVQRAQAILPGFQLTQGNVRAIAEICVRLDGLPLALELAAARIRVLPPQALLARLSQRFQVLSGGWRTMPERQQTLRNTIQWSYDLLNEQEQRLFRRLSVFVGGCRLSAAEAVCATSSDAAGSMEGSLLDAVASLIDKSLLYQIEQESEEPRLAMSETIHEYGREALAASGEAEVTQRAHAAYYLALAEEAEPRLTSAGKRKWLEWLQQEHENLRAALAWLVQHKEQEAALRLAGALWRFWWMRGHLSEGRTQLARALAAGEGIVATPVHAKALCAAGALAGVQGDFEQAVALCGQSLALCRALGDSRSSATSLSMLGYVALQRSDFAEARSLLEDALTLCREVDDKDGIAWVLINLALVFLFQGEYERARTLLEEAAVLSRESGDSWSIANSLWILALVISFQGDLARAHTLLEESLAVSRQEGYKGGIASSLFVLGQVTLQQGEIATARSQLEESLELFKELGDRQNVAQSLGLLAWILFVQGDYAKARDLLVESLALAREVGSKWYIASCLVGLGAVVVAQGQAVWAAQLLSCAEALCTEVHGVLPLFVRIIQESTSAEACTQLGEEAFKAACAEGRNMTLEQVLAANGPATMPTEAPAGRSSVPHAPKAPSYPADLTAREMEILRLVVQGLTDAQVAERLVISPRTVNWHLTAIYSKLGVSSRSAATRYAIEHQVV